MRAFKCFRVPFQGGHKWIVRVAEDRGTHVTDDDGLYKDQPTIRFYDTEAEATAVRDHVLAWVEPHCDRLTIVTSRADAMMNLTERSVDIRKKAAVVATETAADRRGFAEIAKLASHHEPIDAWGSLEVY